MSKPHASKATPAPSTAPPAIIPPVPPSVEFKVELAHPLDMPAHLTAAVAEGWSVVAIADCRSTNEHAAYFSRIKA